MNQKKNRKSFQPKPTKPFEGLIKQLQKETLVLVNIYKAKDFVKACFDKGIKVDVGSTFKDGVVIYKDYNIEK